MAGKEDQKAAADFTSYYLQQSTKEFAEDLDKIRSADDFKGDALPLLINSLQQGTSMFSAADQKRIVDARKARSAAGEGGGGDSEGEKAARWKLQVGLDEVHGISTGAAIESRICFESQMYDRTSFGVGDPESR
ncbi:ribosome-assembly protein 3-domain-containing protein [Xylariaceae sp. AK1471]|nr:ribosome-assembly protein 3-domain-containing protein [Xylariaceae sp. AK1471]